VCESKEEKRAKKSKGDGDEMTRQGVTAGDILSDQYWKDQQRGCLDHCANHPLYARHMVPFFAEIPTGTLNFLPPLEVKPSRGRYS
jgi:hypothetical protein